MAVATKAQVVELIEKHRQDLRRLGVHRCGLFGSFRREQMTPESDVDLLVEFQPGMKSFDNFMDLCFFLEDLFERSVDVVTPESLSPFLGRRILDEVEYVPLS